MQDKFFISFLVVAGLGLVAFLCWAIPKDVARSERAKVIAEQMGCEYVGRARDLNSVAFVDCKGEVKPVRIK